MATYRQHVDIKPTELRTINPDALSSMTMEQLTVLVSFIVRDNAHIRVAGPDPANRQKYIKLIKRFMPKPITCKHKQQS